MGVDDEFACVDCPLLDKPYVVGYGNPWAPFWVVGTAPGKYESETGVAFSGEHGLLVRNLLEDIGLDMDDIYFTNVLKRRPTDVASGNRKPSAYECWRCGMHLEHEITSGDPRVILTLGSVPFKFVTGMSFKIDDVRGLPMYVLRFGTTLRVTPTFDPAYVSRKGGLVSTTGHEWVLDLQEFARIVRIGKHG